MPLTVRVDANMYNIFNLFWYVPSNAIIGDVVLHQFDVFQGEHIFLLYKHLPLQFYTYISL